MKKIILSCLTFSSILALPSIAISTKLENNSNAKKTEYELYKAKYINIAKSLKLRLIDQLGNQDYTFDDKSPEQLGDTIINSIQEFFAAIEQQVKLQLGANYDLNDNSLWEKFIQTNAYIENQLDSQIKNYVAIVARLLVQNNPAIVLKQGFNLDLFKNISFRDFGVEQINNYFIDKKQPVLDKYFTKSIINSDFIKDDQKIFKSYRYQIKSNDDEVELKNFIQKHKLDQNQKDNGGVFENFELSLWIDRFAEFETKINEIQIQLSQSTQIFDSTKDIAQLQKYNEDFAQKLTDSKSILAKIKPASLNAKKPFYNLLNDLANKININNINLLKQKNKVLFNEFKTNFDLLNKQQQNLITNSVEFNEINKLKDLESNDEKIYLMFSVEEFLNYAALVSKLTNAVKTLSNQINNETKIENNEQNNDSNKQNSSQNISEQQSNKQVAKNKFNIYVFVLLSSTVVVLWIILLFIFIKRQIKQRKVESNKN
ncbi:hypothetical protein EG856_01720 [Mycoplasmopsis phocirhinis]|uniref:Transmembrane protein n=1 Tax=Mycoplasmopsis phocirhinis TaxID=142650 RepID=A0A4P6MLY7_9BACT|nr:hypothetical protein [Mycoplasmopsis phocirhinis]QBF34635.1 hypothetical protein EG856_01720 [Mycoplasmopsis phocirhinis]